MKQPLVSVITSSFNAVKTIEQTINSVINQSYPIIEYIIIDGGSTDGTLEVLKKYNDKITYWISEPDTGIYNAWNKALKVAKGDWIAFLGADDIYYSDAIEKYISFINGTVGGDQLDFISSIIELVDKDLNVIKAEGEQWSWPKFSYYMMTNHGGMLHNKLLFDKYGCFDESYRSSGDYALLLKAGKKLKTGFLDAITIKMREGGISSGGRFLFDEVLRAKLTSKNVPAIRAYFRYYAGLGMFYLRKLKGA
jgi:glycosyltransferase involved in cell wall biosynthesis